MALYAEQLLTHPQYPNSQDPALLGLDSLRESKAITDITTLRLHMCGLDGYTIEEILPPGTAHIQCTLAPSGHMVVPCGEGDALYPHQQGGLIVEHDVALQVSTGHSSSSS